MLIYPDHSKSEPSRQFSDPHCKIVSKSSPSVWDVGKTSPSALGSNNLITLSYRLSESVKRLSESQDSIYTSAESRPPKFYILKSTSNKSKDRQEVGRQEAGRREVGRQKRRILQSKIYIKFSIHLLYFSLKSNCISHIRPWYLLPRVEASNMAST